MSRLKSAVGVMPEARAKSACGADRSARVRSKLRTNWAGATARPAASAA
jgi:hypothetical protein